MTRGVRASLLAPLRVLLPTWRFFDDVGYGLRLEARTGREPSALGAWLPLLAPADAPRRRLVHVLLDGDGNLRLAHRSLLERLALDLSSLSDGDDPRDLLSYVQVLALVRDALRTRTVEAAAQYLQFQLVEPADGGVREALLCSAVHPLRGA